MQTPLGMTEDEVLATIEHIAAKLAPTFHIPGLDVDDLSQQARLFALELLPRYDPRPGEDGRPTQPLENFLMVGVKRRLINCRRDRWKRADSPCAACHDGRPCGPDGRYCDKYRAWHERQERKARVRRPEPLKDGKHDRRDGRDVLGEAEVNELLLLVDLKLGVELRATYLQLRAGKSVPKPRRVAVENAVRGILRDALDLR